jgi:hypothetical protein
MVGKLGVRAQVICVVMTLGALFAPANASSSPALTDSVTIDTRIPIASFRPAEAFGVAVDGGAADESKPIFLGDNGPQMRELASYRASYRLRTELGIEAWHWSQTGAWSDAGHHQGYWTGDASAGDTDPMSYGYRLPRRGDTFDEANNDGYSRIDDGDPATFWKSNPYLDGSYTGVPGDHPDWVVVELDGPHPVDAIEIRWAAPYARRFRVQYWVGEDEYTGRWITFPQGSVTQDSGGLVRLSLSPRRIQTKFVRVLLEQSSHTAPVGATDPRDRLGYAIAEIRLGWMTPDHSLHDLLRHGAGHDRQTIVHVSSTDPWHRAIDRDPDTAQPSLIRMKRLGLIGSSPVMAPIGLLYDTPENMIAMLAHLQHFGVPVGQAELGEEPDGQFVTAGDYGALYVEYARRIRAAFPHIALGGPSLVNGVSDTWLDDSPDQSWTSQFFKYLRARHATDLINFFSFEYFPFDNVCGSASIKLRDETAQMQALYDRLRADGVPRAMPWMITEYGFSAFGGEPLVQMPSALFTADMLGDFLSRGGRTAYLYGVTPDQPIDGEQRCAGHGNLMLWEADSRGRATWPMPSLYAYRLVTQQWSAPGNGLHLLYPARTTARDSRGRALVRAYPLKRPDGRWSLMLINRSLRPVNVSSHFGAGGPASTSPLLVSQYGPAQYQWVRVSESGHPARDTPPRRFRLVGWRAPLLLPPMSLSILSELP